MNNHEILSALSKEQLIELLGIYAKNWLALDGVWFQSVERKFGMDEAMFHDAEAWRRWTVIEAKRIKDFLGLPEHPGLDGLEKALALRFYGNLNDFTFVRSGDTLRFTNTKCRVQDARRRKGMPFHPCKSVGCLEYEGFARTIDDRIACRCVSCFPDVTIPGIGCAWEFEVEGGAHGKT